MTVSQRTKAYSAGDERLKLLWIEDLPDKFESFDPADIGRWFALTVADSPEDVRRLAASSTLPPGEAAEGARRETYSQEAFPFDCYLADFRLCDDHPHGCDDPDHLASGVHAPCAGFLLALMSSLRFTSHPQAIIPYSGWDQEFGSVWSLVSKFCPDSVAVLVDESVNKRRIASFYDIVRVGVRHFRSALAAWTEQGLVHIPLRERDRWERLAQAPGHPDGLDAAECLAVVTEYGRRRIRIGSLFWDHMIEDTAGNHRVRPTAVGEWLALCPAVTPEELEAREIAALYWELHATQESRSLYRLSAAREAGKVPTPSAVAPKFPWLLEWKKAARKEVLDIDSVHRLATLFGMATRHYMYVSAVVKDQKPKAALLERIVRRFRESDAATVADELVKDPLGFFGLPSTALAIDRVEMAETLAALFTDWQASRATGDDPFREFEWAAPPSEEDVVRFLDPFPPTWTPTLTLNPAEKVGKGLDRKLHLDVKRLLSGDGSELRPVERRVVGAFMRELLPIRASWPRWLQ